jgi:hypothetical protein
MPFTYKENNIGDKCPPCGTPEEIFEMDDLHPNTFTHWTLSDK